MDSAANSSLHSHQDSPADLLSPQCRRLARCERHLPIAQYDEAPIRILCPAADCKTPNSAKSFGDQEFLTIKVHEWKRHAFGFQAVPTAQPPISASLLKRRRLSPPPSKKFKGRVKGNANGPRFCSSCKSVARDKASIAATPSSIKRSWRKFP